jgi:hypothetical protein
VVGEKDGKAGVKVKGQTVYVLDGGFVKWQEVWVFPLLASRARRCGEEIDLLILRITGMEKIRNSQKTTKKTSGSLDTRSTERLKLKYDDAQMILVVGR